MARGFGERVTCSSWTQRGLRRGEQRGVEAVSEPVAVLVNPDVELLDASLAELAREVARLGRRADPGAARAAARRHRARTPCTRCPASRPTSRARWCRRRPPAPLGRCSRHGAPRGRGGWAGRWAAASWRARETLRRLGPFDERIFLYAEDLDLGLRAGAAGVETWFWPAARVLHKRAHSSDRAFGGEAFELLAHERRQVIARRRGRAGRRLDDAAQTATFATRFALKRLLREARRARAPSAGDDQPPAAPAARLRGRLSRPAARAARAARRASWRHAGAPPDAARAASRRGARPAGSGQHHQRPQAVLDAARERDARGLEEVARGNRDLDGPARRGARAGRRSPGRTRTRRSSAGTRSRAGSRPRRRGSRCGTRRSRARKARFSIQVRKRLPTHFQRGMPPAIASSSSSREPITTSALAALDRAHHLARRAPGRTGCRRAPSRRRRRRRGWPARNTSSGSRRSRGCPGGGSPRSPRGAPRRSCRRGWRRPPAARGRPRRPGSPSRPSGSSRDAL